MSEKYTCPKCKEPTLYDFNTSEGVNVDFCDKCKGIWFDKDELGRYIELSKDIVEEEAMMQKATKTDLICPKCGGILWEMPFSSKTEFLLDRCENCKGIFLDEGEIWNAEDASAQLEKIEDRLKLVVKQIHEDGYTFL